MSFGDTYFLEIALAPVLLVQNIVYTKISCVLNILAQK